MVEQPRTWRSGIRGALLRETRVATPSDAHSVYQKDEAILAILRRREEEGMASKRVAFVSDDGRERVFRRTKDGAWVEKGIRLGKNPLPGTLVTTPDGGYVKVYHPPVALTTPHWKECLYNYSLYSGRFEDDIFRTFPQPTVRSRQEVRGKFFSRIVENPIPFEQYAASVQHNAVSPGVRRMHINDDLSLAAATALVVTILSSPIWVPAAIYYGLPQTDTFIRSIPNYIQSGLSSGLSGTNGTYNLLLAMIPILMVAGYLLSVRSRD